MKCSKCGFTSFPYLESCRKCGLVLAKSQAAWGLYALHPDPPDLLLAYQTANLDVTRTLPIPAASMPSPDGSEEPVSPAPDWLPALDQAIMTAAELPPLEPPAEPPGSAETAMPHTLDLSELADMTLDLDDTVNRGDTSAQSLRPTKFSPEGQPVYDLDLDGDLDELSLLPLEDKSRTEDADGDEEVLEYTLEIEDNLEIDIDGLELEQDDNTEDEDDDKP